MFAKVESDLNRRLYGVERRRCRIFAPIFYFILQSVLLFEISSLLSLSFNPAAWNHYSFAIFAGGVVYCLAKLFHIYEERCYKKSSYRYYKVLRSKSLF